MKKRTLVCFLIFTLCVFYTAIPNAVFGQEEEASLAEQVIEKHGETLMRREVQGGFLIVLDVLKANPAQAALLNPTTIELVIDGTISLDTLIDRNTLTDEQVTALDLFLPLLAAKDEGVLALLRDTQVLEALKDPAAIDELAAALQPAPTDGETPPTDGETPPTDGETPPTDGEMPPTDGETPPTDGETPPTDGETPPTDGETPPTDGETPPTDGETPPTDGETPPTDGETPPTDGETPPTDGETPPTDGETPPIDGETPPTDGEVVPPPPPIEQAVPFAEIMPTNESLLGKSKLGGLSINRISGRKFLADLVMAATGESFETLATLSGQTQDQLVEMIVQLIPKEVPFTKEQIRRFLKSDNIPIFARNLGELDLASQDPKNPGKYTLDTENFGNAITPMPLDLIYDDRMGDQTDPNRKYLTRDSLNLYVRVPSTNIGGVKFMSSDGTLQKDGERVSDPSVLGSETISYTFRLEEALAATNLPAWPALENNLEQLFAEVTLRYSNTELDGPYSGHTMMPKFTDNGVVWETEVDVTQGNSFYYFEVELATSVTLEVLDREQLAKLFDDAAAGNLPSISDVLNATLDPPLEIKMWAMPDPRNLQLADRGILNALFDDDFRAALTTAVGPLLAKMLSGESPTQQEFVNTVQKHRARLQNILLYNSNRVTTQFESGFDPMLSSVFSIPKIDPESESLWVASFDDTEIQDGNYFVGAVVHDENNNPLDQMWSDVTVDTKAPEAEVEIEAGDNTTVYENVDGVYVATTLEPGAATLTVTGIPGPGRSNYVAEAEGYLLYQIIGLDSDGNPYLGESSLQRPNTWMPLTPEATMLASTVWKQTIEQLVRQGLLPEEIDLPPAASLLGLSAGVTPTKELPLNIVSTALPLLATPAGLGFIENDPTFGPIIKDIKALGDFLGEDLLDPKVINLLNEVFGAAVDIINHIPITYGAPPNYNKVSMLAQLDKDVFAGHYGIRAMGIDNLFNVSSHTAPTRLRIVDPVTNIDRATITVAQAHGDFDNDGMLDPVYKTDIIYRNSESVMISGTVKDLMHPIKSVMLQYMDASRNWANIGEATVMGADFEGTWNVTDFDALIGAGDSVRVRAIATNALQLRDDNPPTEYEYTIALDDGIYPPEVLALVVDEASMTNPDSGAPQGMIDIKAYTLSQTGPQTGNVRFELEQSDGTIVPLGIADQGDTPTDPADALQAALASAIEGTDASLNPDDYHEWTLTIDTTELADTITKDSLAARDVSKDDNQHTIRAFAVSADATEWPSDATTMLSVDNVDDVGPLGPTNITAIANTGGMVEADTHRGLVDENDPSVVPQSITLTIEPTAVRKTYTSVMLVSVPKIDAAHIREITEPVKDSGIFMVTVNIGALGVEGNGTYTFQALVDDEPQNGQDGDSPKSTIHVKNYERPDPAVFKLTVDDETETKNADSGGPQGTFMFTGYTIEQNSPPIEKIRLEAKRANDTDWTTIGEGNAGTSIHIEDAALKDTVAHLVGVAAAGTETGDKSVVAIGTTNKQWVVSVDTVALELEDTITVGSPGERDVSKDDNQYTVRAFAVDASGKEWASDATVMFSLDNVDDVAPLAPTSISVTSVDGVDTNLEASEDGSFTVGGLVDKYDDAVPSPVATFTIKPVADRHTYKSVRLAMYPEGALVGEITETAEGSGEFTVTVDVGTLADGETYLEEGTYVFQALASDEFGNEETDGSKISVTVDNDYRPAPEVLVIAVDPESITQTNPDSGAPQGTIVLNARSHEITSPPTSGMKFEAKRPSDEAWTDVGTATESMLVSDVSDAELTDFVGDVASSAVSATEANESGEPTVVPIDRSQTYQEWMLEVDTTTLEDTITADSPAARDASKDDNQYMVRVTAIAEADGSETVSADGITAHFSVDNVDDVAPVGPTKIVAVADVAGMIAANEDGSYTVGGIVDDTVPSPIAIFTTEPTADPTTYASVNLVQTADGAETITEGEAGVLDITIDVGLLENGTYMFHALAVDESGNVQTDESPMITVHVLNFRVSDVTDLAVIAVDGADVAEPPTEPIPLRESVTVSFMVVNGSLTAEELSSTVDGSEVPSESAEDPENTFSLMVEVGALVDGVYTPDGVVTKRNGSVAFPITTVNVDNTGPMVTIESPTEDETVDSLPTLRATYHDGAGSGVDGETGSLAVARLQPPNEVEVVVDQAELEKDAASLVYTRSEPLAGGAYRVTVQVTDNLGNVGEGSAEFAVNGTAPTVAIHSPASGQTFEHGEPLISGEFSGAGTVEVTTFTINDVDATPEVDGNRFSYTPEEALADGNHTVVVAVTDGDGNMAQTSVTFAVEMPKDTTPPVISSVAPTGVIKGDSWVTLSAVVTDEQSSVVSVRFSINDEPFRSVPSTEIAEGRVRVDSGSLTPGTQTVSLRATSQGGTTEHTWTFTLIVDNVKPTITSITPSGTIRGGLPVISASASDESGVDKMTIVVIDSDGEEVEGNTEDDGESDVEGITRVDFNPEEPLEEGTYTIEVRAVDPYENAASAKGTFTIDFDTAAPIITMASPHQNARFILKPGEKAPTVSITYADAESGINVESITLVIEGVDSDYKATPSGTKITLQPGQKSASQVMHPLLVDTNAKPETWAGEYVVRFEVTDNAHMEGNVSEKNDGAREANRTVHTFSFFLEAAEGPIMAARPLNYPNPFKDSTRISFSLARQATVSIVIYDTTLRPVRVLVDNRVFDAGNYTLKENGSDAIGWDGTSSSGEDLARGIYFCEIIVADGFEPEYAILKLALTR